MFKFSKARTGVAASALILSSFAILLASQSATAGLDKLTKKKGKTKPTDVESMARVPDKASGNVFSCWQEGRLVFKKAGFEIGAGQLPGATRIKTGRQTFQVLDLKQGMCILQQAGAKDE